MSRVLVPPPPIHETVALFVAGLKKLGAEALLEGFVDAWVGPAQARLHEVMALEAPQRRALVAATFGMRRDAAERLRSLFSMAHDELAAELHRQLPAHQKALFNRPAEVTPPHPSSASVRAFAARRLMEAMA